MPASACYRSPGSHRGRRSASSASYFLALGAVGGGPVRCRGRRDSIQGDVAFAPHLESMGVRASNSAVTRISRGRVGVCASSPARVLDADFNLIPDAAMTRPRWRCSPTARAGLRNIGSWRVERKPTASTRCRRRLAKLGAGVSSGPDWLEVTPPAPDGWRDAEIGTWDDHRMAMSMSLAAFGPAAVRILDPGRRRRLFPRISMFGVPGLVGGEVEPV